MLAAGIDLYINLTRKPSYKKKRDNRLSNSSSLVVSRLSPVPPPLQASFVIASLGPKSCDWSQNWRSHSQLLKCWSFHIWKVFKVLFETELSERHSNKNGHNDVTGRVQFNLWKGLERKGFDFGGISFLWGLIRKCQIQVFSEIFHSDWANESSGLQLPDYFIYLFFEEKQTHWCRLIKLIFTRARNIFKIWMSILKALPLHLQQTEMVQTFSLPPPFLKHM